MNRNAYGTIVCPLCNKRKNQIKTFKLTQEPLHFDVVCKGCGAEITIDVKFTSGKISYVKYKKRSPEEVLIKGTKIWQYAYSKQLRRII